MKSKNLVFILLISILLIPTVIAVTPPTPDNPNIVCSGGVYTEYCRYVLDKESCENSYTAFSSYGTSICIWDGAKCAKGKQCATICDDEVDRSAKCHVSTVDVAVRTQATPILVEYKDEPLTQCSDIMSGDFNGDNKIDQYDMHIYNEYIFARVENEGEKPQITTVLNRVKAISGYTGTITRLPDFQYDDFDGDLRLNPSDIHIISAYIELAKSNSNIINTENVLTEARSYGGTIIDIVKLPGEINCNDDIYQESYRIVKGKSLETKGKKNVKCNKVSNNFDNDLFVPAKTDVEYDSFINNLPSKASKGDCKPNSNNLLSSECQIRGDFNGDRIVTQGDYQIYSAYLVEKSLNEGAEPSINNVQSRAESYGFTGTIQRLPELPTDNFDGNSILGNPDIQVMVAYSQEVIDAREEQRDISLAKIQTGAEEYGFTGTIQVLPGTNTCDVSTVTESTNEVVVPPVTPTTERCGGTEVNECDNLIKTTCENSWAVNEIKSWESFNTVYAFCIWDGTKCSISNELQYKECETPEPSVPVPTVECNSGTTVRSCGSLSDKQTCENSNYPPRMDIMYQALDGYYYCKWDGTKCIAGESCFDICDGTKQTAKCSLSTETSSAVPPTPATIAPSCSDNIKNQDETDIDCGGTFCGDCINGKTCVSNNDCVSNICNNNKVCSAPSCSDNLKNQAETDVDCGGNCPKCSINKKCSEYGDCQSNYCSGGLCKVDPCKNGVQDGTEADIDCGGSCTQCPINIVILPIEGSWSDENSFKQSAKIRVDFFKDISQFKTKKLGVYYAPKSFIDSKCTSDVFKKAIYTPGTIITPADFTNLEARMKPVPECGIQYANSLGLNQDNLRIVGFTNRISGGFALKNKAVYVGMGLNEKEYLYIMAHELAHTWKACDEYRYDLYVSQDNDWGCVNDFPTVQECSKDMPLCLTGTNCISTRGCSGSSNIERAYSGPSYSNTCNLASKTSIMGISGGSLCGLDKKTYAVIK